MAFFDGTANDIEDNRNKKSTFDGENPSETSYLSELGVKNAIDTKADKSELNAKADKTELEKKVDKNANPVVIGEDADAGSGIMTNGVAIGNSADVSTTIDGVAIGYDTSAKGLGSVAIGSLAKAESGMAVQLGSGTNSTEGTLQYRTYQLLDASGHIPIERLDKLVSLLQGLKTASSIAEINTLASEILGDENG